MTFFLVTFLVFITAEYTQCCVYSFDLLYSLHSVAKLILSHTRYNSIQNQSAVNKKLLKKQVKHCMISLPY